VTIKREDDAAYGKLPAWLEELLPSIQDEMRRIAAAQLGRTHQGRRIRLTSLVDEAWVRLLGLHRIDWKDKNHLVAVASICLWQALVDRIRAERAAKRGGDWKCIELPADLEFEIGDPIVLIDLHDALAELEHGHWRVWRVVILRIFGGISSEEIAKVLDVAPRTVAADWRFALAWLKTELSKGDTGEQ
jgi:RNA polymerase sigma factor (TIGR02999 family)